MAGTAHPRSDGGASMKKAPTATNESGAFEIERPTCSTDPNSPSLGAGMESLPTAYCLFPAGMDYVAE